MSIKDGLKARVKRDKTLLVGEELVGVGWDEFKMRDGGKAP